MPDTTGHTLNDIAFHVYVHGLHTGTQFAQAGGRIPSLDICAIAYLAAEGNVPTEFFTDEVASIRLIECSAGAMQAIRAISDALDTEPCTTEITPGVDIPDYIEHVSNWAATPPVGETTPPTAPEVTGRILRAARSFPAADSNAVAA
ncbi:hypothetical protein ACIPW9_36545 [Streptomyces sp. NPDC090052]|uniref:hypothetical protein n=1 Tax=Streptomyces sp. NPDC090052 TaxID=3365931 RepID=UPI0038158D84